MRANSAISAVETPENKTDVHDAVRVAFPTYVMELSPEETGARVFGCDDGDGRING